jgi:hypothetical protein
LSDFEVTDEEEEDIFTESEENVLRQASEETSKWYQSWDKPSTSNEGCDAAVDPDDMSPNSETFDSMSSDEDAEGEHHPRRVKRYPEWMSKRDLKEKVQLSVGLKFSNPTKFKKALQVFAVQNSFDYKYQDNEKTRVSAVCKKNCPWRIHASWSNCKSFFQIKTFHANHNCGSHYHNKRASIPWAANRYLDSFRDNRDLKPKALREMIRRDYHVGMKPLSCHRAKRKALEILDGIDGEQYKYTREYANALLHWNQGSSAYIQRDGVFFQRMYVSLAACK